MYSLGFYFHFYIFDYSKVFGLIAISLSGETFSFTLVKIFEVQVEGHVNI